MSEAKVLRNLTRSQLIEEFVKNHEGDLSKDGALLVRTGEFTGRAAKDKYIVRNSASESVVDWGEVNQSISPECFDGLKKKVLSCLKSKGSYVQDLSVGADPEFALPLEVHTTHAHQSLFAKSLFRPRLDVEANLPPFSVFCAPEVVADPAVDGTRSSTFVVLNFETREVVIGGTKYSGEIKKSVFTIMNTILPQMGVMTMHAAANVGEQGDCAIFFGLSGTGKTTLSSDPNRRLVGDDEHGWSDRGVFNFEGGCYAKAIKLSKTAEPQIWQACHSYGTIIENVVYDEHTRLIDFDSAAITENTRAAYPLDCIPNSVQSGQASAPRAIIMLACDAYGVLPPVAKLNSQQAMYYFLSGYTAKVAGTEAGITEPTTTFSACFGQPFMTMKPTVYANLLAERIEKSGSECYLVNTGWWKGPFGVGERMPINISRAIVSAAIDGSLSKVESAVDPIFGFDVPVQIPGLEMAGSGLSQMQSWSSAAAYEDQSKKLAGLFSENFLRYSGSEADRARMSGPRI